MMLDLEPIKARLAALPHVGEPIGDTEWCDGCGSGDDQPPAQHTMNCSYCFENMGFARYAEALLA